MKHTFIDPHEVADTLNGFFLRKSIDLSIKPYVDLDINSDDKFFKWNRTDKKRLIPEDKLSTYLQKSIFKPIEGRAQSFYHYLPKIEYLNEILDTGCIRLYNLNKFLNNNNDPKEFKFFLESFGINFPKYEEQIKSIKDDIFIWCLTKSSNNERHWETYGNKGQGVVVEVNFKFTEVNNGCIQLMNICYDLDFLKELQILTKEKFNKIFDITGYPLFAKYFKEKRFEWENETRLSFDNNLWYASKAMQAYFKHEFPEAKELNTIFEERIDPFSLEKYILVPLKNSLFEIEIVEIIKRNI